MTQLPSDQTWIERNDGWQHTDALERTIEVRVSRFHGPMISVDGHHAYLGDEAATSLINYLIERKTNGATS